MSALPAPDRRAHLRKMLIRTASGWKRPDVGLQASFGGKPREDDSAKRRAAQEEEAKRLEAERAEARRIEAERAAQPKPKPRATVADYLAARDRAVANRRASMGVVGRGGSIDLSARAKVDAEEAQAKAGAAEAFAALRARKESERLAAITPEQLASGEARARQRLLDITRRLQGTRYERPGDKAMLKPTPKRGRPKKDAGKTGLAKAAALLAGADSREYSFGLQVEKAAKTGRYVAGWASVIEVDGQPVTDIQGDVIDMDDLRKSAHGYISKAREAKAMHEGAAIGEVVESVLIDDEFAKANGIPHGKRGWWIGMAVTDPKIQKQVRDGVFKGFSIGGSGQRTPIVEKALTPGRQIGRGRTKDVFAHRTKPNVVVVQMQRSPEAESFLEFAREAHRRKLPEAKHLPRVTRPKINGDRITYAAERLQPNPTRARIGRENGKFFATGVSEGESKPLLDTVQALDSHLQRKHSKNSYYFDLNPQNFMRNRKGHLIINDPVESRR